jgi:benzaldehyde dehydrogenase (NAD)
MQINAHQLANVDRIVSATVDAGAELRSGGTHDRLFYRPTVLAGVTAAMPAFREEIFGPVAPVIVVRDDDEAVAVANDTAYGLVAAVQTGSKERGRAVAERLATGIVHVNDQTPNNDAYAPFGGVGTSGNSARFGSQSSWDEFTQWRWLTVRDQPHPFPF